MISKLILPILAVMGVVFAIYTVVSGSRQAPVALPAAEPSRAPFVTYVAGAGIVETYSENFKIGTVVAGVVKDVDVKYGDQVAKGQPLWTIDDRDLQSDLAVKRADVEVEQSMLAAARAKYDRLKQMPRPEEIPPAEARVAADQHSLEDAQDQLKTLQAMSDPGAFSREDFDRRTHAVEIARAHLAQSQADLALLKAGAWDQDLSVAMADVQSAEANLLVAQEAVRSDLTLIDRLTVRAPIDGQVLQVNIHPGEYASAGELASPLMLLGDVHQLVVRTDVDENDAWRVPRNAGASLRAVAYLRGNREIGCELTFYRIEPYVIPKKSLTGDSTERVDTRVLQVLYTFDPADKPIYVGQQMDVYIETAGPTTRQ